MLEAFCARVLATEEKKNQKESMWCQLFFFFTITLGSFQFHSFNVFSARLTTIYVSLLIAVVHVRLSLRRTVVRIPRGRAIGGMIAKTRLSRFMGNVVVTFIVVEGSIACRTFNQGSLKTRILLSTQRQVTQGRHDEATFMKCRLATRTIDTSMVVFDAMLTIAAFEFLLAAGILF